MGKGPLAVRWGDWTLDEPHAGALGHAVVEVENAGSVAWGDGIVLSYHWLDDLDNPIVWDGVRTALPPLLPGERATVDARVRAPIPPGRYRFALDVVAEFRAWFAELGGEMAIATIEVQPREGAHHVSLPDWVEPSTDWHERVAAAHAEGYAVVAGAIRWLGGSLRRQPKELGPYEPGPGRVPGFSHPLLCPSVLEGVELDRLADVAELPAYAAPTDEPWLYDGRIVLTVDPRRRDTR
jgi:hypothetical protein